MVNVPPLFPATALPMLDPLPLTEPTVSVSLSGSVSFVMTLPLVDAFSVVAPASFTAVGAGLVTVHVNVCDAVALALSIAVTVTEYGPDRDALLAIVPEIKPVVGLMDRPDGRPVAEKVKVFVVSTSLKFPAAFKETAEPSAFV